MVPHGLPPFPQFSHFSNQGTGQVRDTARAAYRDPGLECDTLSTALPLLQAVFHWQTSQLRNVVLSEVLKLCSTQSEALTPGAHTVSFGSRISFLLFYKAEIEPKT